MKRIKHVGQTLLNIVGRNANSFKRTKKNIKIIYAADKQILTQYANDTSIFVKDETSVGEASIATN